MKLTLINPHDFARPIANFKLEPEAQCFFSIYAEAQEIRKAGHHQTQTHCRSVAGGARRTETRDTEPRRKLDVLLLQQADLDVGGMRYWSQATQRKTPRTQAP